MTLSFYSSNENLSITLSITTVLSFNRSTTTEVFLLVYISTFGKLNKLNSWDKTTPSNPLLSLTNVLGGYGLTLSANILAIVGSKSVPPPPAINSQAS